MYISLVTVHDQLVNDIEKKVVAFGTERDGCQWTRNATQVPCTEVGYWTENQVQDKEMGYWFFRWESAEHQARFVQANDLPEIFSRSSEFLESFSVLHSVLGPEEAISAVFSAPVIEVVIVKIPNKNDTEETRNELQEALKTVERVLGRAKNTRRLSTWYVGRAEVITP